MYVSSRCFPAAVISTTLLLATAGCSREIPPLSTNSLDGANSPFEIYWPPRDPEEESSVKVNPLLHGDLTVAARPAADGPAELQLYVTITRPSAEPDRLFWNSQLAFADIAWMGEVRVWDVDKKWLWPNVVHLFRLPGRERIERYGGVDPGKGVDNDFAAVLIRKYASDGLTESPATQDRPLVSANWRPVAEGEVGGQAVVHQARSDLFHLRVGEVGCDTRGQIKVWLIYADFLGARPPRNWPRDGEWAGGILAYFEIDWSTTPAGRCLGVIRRKKPAKGTGFDWERWVDHRPGMEQSAARMRLSDDDP